MFEHALVVADQHVQRIDARQHRSFRGGDGQTAHAHRHEQPGGLQRDGFAAGVRAADDRSRGGIAVQLDRCEIGTGRPCAAFVFAECLLARCGEALVEQGMASVEVCSSRSR